MTDPVKFLTSIWTQQARPGEYLFLSTRRKLGKDKNGKEKIEWKDHSIQYEGRVKLRNQLKQFFKEYDSKQYDIYFCTLPYIKPKRGKEGVPRTKFLWQDLDYADPKKFDKRLKPTIYWESSPGRFHGLWRLDKQYRDIDEIEKLNKDLAYHIGADKGGWDLGQVLRVPGTHNLKYDDKPLVKLKRNSDKAYRYNTLRERVPENKELSADINVSRLNEGDPQEILSKYAGTLPRDILTLLLQKEAEVGKRSETIWHLENRLYELGLTPDEIFTLIKHSAWNKYRGRHDEDERLTKELQKIISEAASQSLKEPEDLDLDEIGLVVETYDEVMSNIRSYPGWLVEGFWARRSHGIVAGEPKVFKSTFTLDLAISVASGQPFLGKFPVLEPGPVILVQNENAEWLMKDKIEKVIANRGLAGSVKRISDRTYEINFPRSIPLYSINQQGYLLNNPEHQEAMEKLIQEIKPVLVIFDPLYLMFDGDINSAKELNPVLNWLLKLKNDYKTGVMLIHHYNKGTGGTSWRGGQRMLGSTTLHGWIESAWYLQANEPEEASHKEVDKVSDSPASVIMTREFRTAGHYPKIELKLKMGEFGTPRYEVDAEVYQEEGKAPVNKKLTTDQIAAEILKYMQSRTVGDIIQWNDLMEAIGVGRRGTIQEAGKMAALTESSLEVTAIGIKKNKEYKLMVGQ